MASTSSRIQIIIDGATRGVREAAARARAELAGMRDEVERNDKAMSKIGAGLGGLAKITAVLGALGGVIPLIVGTTAALQQLLPVALLAPAAILALGAAYGTFKLATSGVGDALKGDAEALAKLAPSARSFVDAVRSFSGEFDRLKRSVQDRFFQGFGDDVRALGSTYFPILQRRLPEIAGGFNAMGRSVAYALTRPRASADIEIVLAQTAKFLDRARNAAGAFVGGFTGLAAIGSTYLPNLGRAIDGVAQKFERWVARAGSDGTIRKMIDGALQGFRDLFAIIGNVASALGLLFSGLSTSTASPLASLRELTQAVRDFLAETATQDALKAFGEALATISGVVRDVLLAALHELAPIVADLAPVFADVAGAIGDQLVNAIHIVGPILADLAKFLNDHKDLVGIIAQALLILYGRFLLYKGISFVVGALRPIVAALGGLSGVLRKLPIAVLGAAAVEIDKINVAAAGGDPDKLTGLAENLHDIVEAGKQILSLDFAGILADIQGELDQVGQGFATGSSPIGGLVQTVIKAHEDYLRATGEILDSIGQFFSDLGQRASDFVTKTGESLGKIGTFFSELPGKIGDALSSAGTALLDAGTRLVQPIVDGAKQKFQDVVDFFSQSPYEIGFAIGAAIGTLLQSGIDLVEQLRLGAVQKFEEVKTFFGTTVPQSIADSLINLSTTLLAKGTEAVQALQDGATQKFEEVKTFFGTTVPEAIANALLVLGPQLAQKAIDAWQQFKDAAGVKIDEAVAFVADLPRRIGEALGILPSQTKTAGTQTGQGFQDGAKSKFDETVAFVAGIPGKVVAALGNVDRLLTNAGKAIIDGLLAGIKSGYQAMIEFVGGIAAGIAANKGPLPYDRRVLIPAGLALMSGLLRGIRTGYGDVQGFVGSIADGLAGTLDTGSIIRSASAATTALGRAGTSSRTVDETPVLLRQILAAIAEGKDVRVFIGDTELKSLVRTEVGSRDRATARTVTAGSRAV